MTAGKIFVACRLSYRRLNIGDPSKTALSAQIHDAQRAADGMLQGARMVPNSKGKACSQTYVASSLAFNWDSPQMDKSRSQMMKIFLSYSTTRI